MPEIPAYSVSKLAHLLDVDRRTVAKALAGVKPDGKLGAHPTYSIGSAHASLLAMALGREAAGEGEALDLKAERARLAKEQADAQELKNLQTRGEVLKAEDVLREWQRILSMVKSMMLSLPSTLPQKLPHLSAHDIDTIDREIRRVLDEAGTTRREKLPEA